MKERKSIFKRIGYLLMIITLTIVAFLAPRFIEKEVNAVEIKGKDVYDKPFAKGTTLSQVTIASDNANPKLAKVGDTITLSITANEDIQGLKVRIAEKTVDVTRSGDTYIAAYTVTSSTTEGVVKFNITYDDELGSTVVVVTTDLSKVRVDRTIPALSGRIVMRSYSEYDSDYWYHSAAEDYAKTGEIIILFFSLTEEPATLPTVTIAGQTATVIDNGFYSSITNKYIHHFYARLDVVEETPEGLAEGVITYTDEAGNAGSSATTGLEYEIMIVDNTAPTLPTVTIESDNINNSTFAKVGDTITVHFTTSEMSYIETVTIAGQNARIRATMIGGDWLDINNPPILRYTATYKVVAETPAGLAGINIIYKDMVLNYGTEVTITDSSAVTVDNEAPVIISSPEIIGLSYTLSANEKIGEYSIDEGATWIQVTTPSDSISITFPTTGIYKIIVKDIAGNESIMHRVICNAYIKRR